MQHRSGAAPTTYQQLQQQQHKAQAAAGAYNAPPASRWAARKVLTGAVAPLHSGAATIATDFLADNGGYVSVRCDSIDGQRLASSSRLQALSRSESAPSAASSSSASESASHHAATAVAFCSVPRDSASTPGEMWVAWSNGKITILTEAANKVLATLPSIAPTCGSIVSLVCFYAGSSAVPLAAGASVSGSHAPAEGAWLFSRSQRASRSAVLAITSSGTMLCIDTRSRALLFRVPPAHTPRFVLVRCACALADDTRAIVLMATEDCMLHAVELVVSSSSRPQSPAASSGRFISPHQHRNGQPHCTPRVIQVVSVAPPQVNVGVECAPMCMSVSTPFLRDPQPTVFIGFLTGHATFCRIISSSLSSSSSLSARSEYMILYNSAVAMTLAHDYSDPVIAVIPIQHGAGCITVSPQGACVFSIAATVSAAPNVSAWTVIQRVGGFYPENAAAMDGEQSSFPVGGTALGNNEAVILLSDGGLRRLLVENPEPVMSPPKGGSHRHHHAYQRQQREHHPESHARGSATSPNDRSGAAATAMSLPGVLSPQRRNDENNQLSEEQGNQNNAGREGGGGGGNMLNVIAELEERDFFPMEMLSPTEAERRNAASLPRPTPWRAPREEASGGHHHHHWHSPAASGRTPTAAAAATASSRGGQVVTTNLDGVGTFTSTIDHAMHLADCVQRHYAAEEHFRDEIMAESDSDVAWLWNLHSCSASSSSFFAGDGGRRGRRTANFLFRDGAAADSGRSGIVSLAAQGLVIDTAEIAEVVDFFRLQFEEQELRRRLIVDDFVPSVQSVWHFHAFEMRAADLFAGERRMRRRMIRDEEDEHHLLTYLLWSVMSSAMSSAFTLSSASSAARLASPKQNRNNFSGINDHDDERSARGSAGGVIGGVSNTMLADFERQLGRERSKVESITRENAALGDTAQQLQTLLKQEQRRSEALKRDLDQALAEPTNSRRSAQDQKQAQQRTQQQQQQQAEQAEHRARLQERHRILEGQLIAQRQQLEQQMQLQRRIVHEQQELRRAAIVSPERPMAPPSAKETTTASIQADLRNVQQRRDASTTMSDAAAAAAAGGSGGSVAAAPTVTTNAALALEMAHLRRTLEEEQIKRADAERILAATRSRLDTISSVVANSEVESRQLKTTADVAAERNKLLAAELTEVRGELTALRARAERAESMALKFEAEFRAADTLANKAARERDMALQTTEAAVSAVEDQATKMRSHSSALEALRRSSKRLLTLCDIAVSVGSEPPAFAALRKFMRELQLDLGAFKRLDALQHGQMPVGQRMGELQVKTHEIQEALFNPANPSVVVLEKRDAVGVMTDLRAAVEVAGVVLGMAHPESAPPSVARGSLPYR